MYIFVSLSTKMNLEYLHIGCLQVHPCCACLPGCQFVFETQRLFCVSSRHILSFTQVRGFARKGHSPHPSLNESLEGEIQAFLTDEDQLHTYDDLTKVNPVTPTTGEDDHMMT